MSEAIKEGIENENPRETFEKNINSERPGVHNVSFDYDFVNGLIERVERRIDKKNRESRKVGENPQQNFENKRESENIFDKSVIFGIIFAICAGFLIYKAKRGH